MKETCFLGRFKILSSSMLKLIAMLAMILDHAAYTFRFQFPVLEESLFHLGTIDVTPYYVMRAIGRIAFPIFCFLIAEGIAHTKDIRKYGMRLLILAVISELPFDMLLTHKWIFLGKQNVFFTLLLGVLLVYVYENVKTEWKKWLCMVAVCVIAVTLKADYGLAGVLLIFVMHIFRDKAGAKTVLAYPLLSNRLTPMAAFVPIFMYNGQRGFIRSKGLQYAFYFIYPLHMLALVGISYLLWRNGIWG